MPRVILSSIGLSALLAFVTAYMVSEGEAAVTVGRCALPESLLATIAARGNCPDYTGAQTCPDEVGPCNGACVGAVYNPQEQCEEAEEICYELCAWDCLQAANAVCEGDPECIEDFMLICTYGCDAACDYDCEQQPNESRKECQNEFAYQYQYTDDPNIAETVTTQADDSEYEEIPYSEFSCFQVTDCGTYCKLNQMDEFYCVTGATTPSQPPYKIPSGAPTEGNCPPGS